MLRSVLERRRKAPCMSYVGLDLSRKRIDDSALDGDGVVAVEAAAPPGYLRWAILEASNARA